MGLGLIASLLIIGGTAGYLGNDIIHGKPEVSVSSARLTTHVLSWDADDLYSQSALYGTEAYCEVLDHNENDNTEHECLVLGYNISTAGTPVVGRVDCEFETQKQYMEFFYE